MSKPEYITVLLCSNIHFRLFFVVQQGLLHSHGMVTSVNVVQSGKYNDMEKQSVTVWELCLKNSRKDIISIVIEISEP